MRASETGSAAIPFSVHGEGPHAIMVIHGFLDAGCLWSSEIANSQPSQFTAVSIDLPGMGALTGEEGPLLSWRFG